MQPQVGAAKTTGAAVLSRALEMKGGEVPPEGARFILNLGIRDEDKKRTLDLLTRQQEGKSAPMRRRNLRHTSKLTTCYGVVPKFLFQSV